MSTKNLHFYNEWDIHMNSKTDDESYCGLDFDLLTTCFNVLGEGGIVEKTNVTI